MSVENHIIKVSFCGTFQKAVKPKRSGEAIGNITARMYANFANRVKKYYPSVMRQEDSKEQ